MAASSSQGGGLTVLRLFLGVFFLFEGISKIGWLLDSSPLTAQLTGYVASATTWNRWYLTAVCIPGAPLFARMVLFGEIATGLSFLLGAYARITAVLAFLMVLNIHFASGALFQYKFLTNGYGLPVLGGLLALAIGAVELPMSLRK